MSAGESWLELLLRDASAEELDEHRATQPSGPDAEAEARRALQLQTRLRDRAQRAASLGALSDIASRLVSVRDLPELLQDIAVRARQLLRTDLAYLALLEGEVGEAVLRIRYFDGVLGPSAQEIRLDPAAGLAGRIVHTGRWATTGDYLADHTIRHEPQADSFAGAEQLRSILGVPLRAHGTTLGVLFAGERAVRPFTEAESSLLAGLAGHAAVAIENARLFDAERCATSELRAVNELLRANAAAVDRAVVLHERLTRAAVLGGGPSAVVQALSDVLDLPVQLVDADDQPLAGPDLGVPAPSGGLVGDRRRTVVRDLAATGGADEDGAGVVVLCPVVAAEDYLGCLVARVEDPAGAPGGRARADEADVRLLERGALGIALSLVQERAVAEAASRSRGELLSALLEGGESAVLQQRAAGLRVDLNREHVLAVVQPEEAAARGTSAELVRRHEGLLVERGGHLVLLLPSGVDLAPLAQRATVGLSAPTTGATGLPQAYAAARRCLDAALALGRCRLVASAETLGVYSFLLGSRGPHEAAEFVERTVGPLLRYDAARSAELCRTLEEYLANGRQHTAAAESLHIHPNTLYQRLGRVSTVLGEAWREPDQALDLLVALRLHRLAGAL